MKKIILIILLILVIGLPTGYYINYRIKVSNFNEKLQNALGKDAGLIETILKVESESLSMSFQELFNLCDKSVNDRTNIIVDLRGLYPQMESKLKDSLIDFLNKENELVRAKSQAYRQIMNFSTNLKLLREYKSEYHYSYDEFYYSQLHKYKSDILENISEMDNDLQTFRTNYNSLIIKEKNISLLIKKESLRFIPFFDKYKKSNFKFIETNLEDNNFVLSNYIK